MRNLTREEVSHRVKYSPIEKKYLIFAEDGATIVGRSFLRESAITMLLAYHAARAALARKGKVSEYKFRSAIYGDVPLIPEGMSDQQRKTSDRTEAGRRHAELIPNIVTEIGPPKDYPEEK